MGDLPEPFDLTVDESYIGEDGELYVGDVRIMDARRAVRETAPDVVDQVRILAISAPIPNDTLSFGPDFPAEVQQQILDALCSRSAGDTRAWEATALLTSYSWTGVAPIDDATYDSVRLPVRDPRPDRRGYFRRLDRHLSHLSFHTGRVRQLLCPLVQSAETLHAQDRTSDQNLRYTACWR